MGERISDDVIAKCHQCGAPCDSHTNCANDACHVLSYSVILAKQNTTTVALTNVLKSLFFQSKSSVDFEKRATLQQSP